MNLPHSVELSDMIEDITIDDFLNYIKAKKLSIFMPNENFLTVFHNLLLQCRKNDLKQLVSFMKDNQEIYEWETLNLNQKFKTNILNDEDELEPNQIMDLYSNLLDLVGKNTYNEKNDKEVLEFINSLLAKNFAKLLVIF